MRKLLAFLAIAVVIGIIVIANRGMAAEMFGFLYAFPGGDKVAHFAILGSLTLVVTLAFPQSRLLWGWHLPLTPLVILLLISIEELSQAFIPGRSLDALDWLANLAGIALGGVVGGRATQLERARHPK